MKRRILYAMPTYSGALQWGAHQTLLAAQREAIANGWEVDFYPRSGDSMVHRARNVLFTAFYNGNYDDVLFVDSDIAAKAGSFARIMNAPVDFVGGTYRSKTDKETYVHKILETGQMRVEPDTKLIEVAGIPGGYMRLTRAAATKLVETFQDRWFTDTTLPPDMNHAYCLFDFHFDERQNILWSEDFWFCQLWRNHCGGKVWLDPALKLDHIGEKAWEGDYVSYLQTSPDITRLSEIEASIPNPVLREKNGRISGARSVRPIIENAA